MTGRDRPLAALFFLSGATALVYETIFAKELGHVFGVTAYAATTVIASYMGGIALGAWLLGRLADRPPPFLGTPLRLYAALELVIGLYALLVPTLLEAVTPAYIALHRATSGGLGAVTALRVAFSGLLLLPPTLLMGGTLPAVVRGALVAGPAGPAVARLYAVNTLGAAAGVLVGTYVALPTLGIRGALFATCAVNVVLAIAAVRLDRASVAAPAPRGAEAATMWTPAASLERSLLLVAAAASGFLVLSYEVLWTHLLAVVIGNSVYAFGIMLFVFLCGLGVGSALARRATGSDAAAARALVLSQACAGLFVLVVLPLWDDLPAVFTLLPVASQTFERVELLRFATAVLLLAGPTVLMGLAFPLAMHLYVGATPTPGRALGRAVLANTSGGIAGSLATGFVLLPALGSYRLAAALSLAQAILGAGLATLLPTAARVRGARPVAAGLLAASAVAAAVLPGWDWTLLTSGTNVYGYAQNQRQRLLFVDEDVRGGVTTVTRDGRETTLWTNGKFQGNDRAEMPAQERMGHLLMLFAPPRARTLVIGLGTGATLGTVLRYDVASADVAEIAPGITRAARTHFAGVNGRALDDPRVTLHEADGRNMLLLGGEDRRYDAIQAEISSIWFAGAADLFNVEFFRLARKRLAPGGVLEVWIQLHHIEAESLMMATSGMRDAFPHTTVWLAEYQGILLGSDRPLSARWDRVRANEMRSDVQATLARVPLRSLFTLFGQEVAGPDAPMRYRNLLVRAGLPPYSTDENLRLEFDTPRGNVLGWNLAHNVAILRSFSKRRRPPVEGVPGGWDGMEGALVEAYAAFGARRPSEAVRRFEGVRARWPGSEAATRADDALRRIRERRTVAR